MRMKPAGGVQRFRFSMLLVLLGAISCKRGSDHQANDSTSAAADSPISAMPDMPGMPASTKDTVHLTAAQIQKGGIRWESALMGTTMASATVPGLLVANEDRTSRLGAPARGRVLSVRVRPGDRVTQGTTLLVMQSPDAGAAQADVAKANAEVTSRRAQLAYATSARDRAQRLLDLKSIPRQDYERAVAEEELARATLTQSEAELARAQATANQLGAAGASPGELVLRSPLAGVVLDRDAVPGTVVDVGAPLLVVTDPSTLWLSIDVPEALAGGFARGSRIRFTVTGDEDDTLTARIDAVGAGLDPARRTLPVRALVNNASRRLRPEMLATALAEAGRPVPAILLPDDAVQQLNDQLVVFIAQPDAQGGAKFTARTIQVGSRLAGRAAVISGLSAAELVVVAGAFGVKAELKKGTMREMGM